MSVAGAGAFVAMMATGYYYNVTFIQLGLLDLGARHLGLPSSLVATLMAVFALVTCIASLGFGVVMTRFGWSSDMRMKLRIAAAVAVVTKLP